MDAVILWAGIRVPLLLGGLPKPLCPVVIYGGNPFHHGRWVRLVSRLAEWFSPVHKSVKIIGCSEHVSRTLARAPYYRHYPVCTLFNPIDVPETNPYEARNLTPTGVLRIGMVARLDPIKDHATVLRAFSRLRARWPQARLELAGEGALRSSLETLARELHLEGSVVFHGSIGDVPGFLKSLDLFVYSTTEEEGMGSALAEALAYGLPCVVSALPVMREVVGEPPAATMAVAGSPEAFGEAMEIMLIDDEARRRVSSDAFTRAQTAFSARRIVGHYLQKLELSP